MGRRGTGLRDKVKSQWLRPEELREALPDSPKAPGPGAELAALHLQLVFGGKGKGQWFPRLRA